MDYEKLFKKDLSKMSVIEKEKIIKLQVSFINKKLKENPRLSVTKLIKKDMKLNKSTIVSRFTTNGYRYDESQRSYVPSKKANELATVLFEQMSLTQENNNCMSDTEVAVTTLNDSDLIDQSVINDLKDILELKDIIKEMAEGYIQNKHIIDIDVSNKLQISLPGDQDIITRTIKIYKGINEDWKSFCDKNKHFKMQDLYSQALLEFMNKYK